MAISSLPWCLPPSLLFSLLFMFLSSSVLFFWKGKSIHYLSQPWETAEKVNTISLEWHFLFRFFSPSELVRICVCANALCLIIWFCYVVTNQWILEWLISGAYYHHGMTALAIVLATFKLLLSEVLAALPSLAQPLHRLVKEVCWGPGRSPAECSSGWQDHSASVICFRLTLPSYYFSGETWLQHAEKLGIRCVFVCACPCSLTIIVNTRYHHYDSRSPKENHFFQVNLVFSWTRG